MKFCFPPKGEANFCVLLFWVHREKPLPNYEVHAAQKPSTQFDTSSHRRANLHYFENQLKAKVPVWFYLTSNHMQWQYSEGQLLLHCS